MRVWDGRVVGGGVRRLPVRRRPVRRRPVRRSPHRTKLLRAGGGYEARHARVVAKHVTQVERSLLESDPSRGLEVVEGVQPDFVPTEDHFLGQVGPGGHLVGAG